MNLDQSNEASHARGITPQAWSAFVHVDRHHDTKLSSYETREILGLFDRKALSIYAQLFTISRAVIHDPNGQTKLRQSALEHLDRYDLSVTVVERFAKFREFWMRYRPKIVSISGHSWRRPHETCECGILPIHEGSLPMSVMDAEAITRRGFQQRRVSEQRPDHEFPLMGTERSCPGAPAK